MIRALVVDDSKLFQKLIARSLEADPEIQVVATAANGKEAIYQVAKHKPDIVTMDIFMPDMDGIKAIEEIMAYFPLPILVVSSVVSKNHTDNAVLSLGAGALDILEKPAEGDFQDFAEALRAKVKVLAGVNVITHPKAKLSPLIAVPRSAKNKVVAIGSSTGGPGALRKVLSRLPSGLPGPFLVVQHISAGFVESLAEWLREVSHMPIRVARIGEKAEPGEVIIAPDGHHLQMMRNGRINLTTEDNSNGHRPSVDALMTSMAGSYGSKAIGVLLTGMGRDGSLGMAAIHGAGGQTFVQDEASSIVFGMPKAAIELGVVDRVVPLSKIAQAIIEAFED